MPKGVYKRRQRKPQSAVKKRSTKKRTRAPVGGQEVILAAREDSEFLTHGSTHSRERAKDYGIIRAAATILATFVAKNALLNHSIPDEVRVAAASVLSRKD